jgi:predicted Zn-ribbon and HTH transcriptional regulator
MINKKIVSFKVSKRGDWVTCKKCGKLFQDMSVFGTYKCPACHG